MRRPAIAILVRYAIALCAVGLAIATTLTLSGEQHHPSVIFLLAVTVSAWFGGLGPGLLATMLSVLAVNYYFIPERNTIDFGPDTWVWLVTYSAAAILINGLQERQRRLIVALRRQDRQKSDFMAVLAHELRNFLSPATNAVAIVKMRASADAASAKACVSAERQLAKMNQLVNDLLDASRVTQGKVQLSLKPENVTAIVKQAVEAARPVIDARHHHLETMFPDVQLLVTADTFRLEQVFVNLLRNAAKYTDAGGKIWVTVSRKDEHVVISVRDNGKGLDPDILPNIFGLFVQAHAGAHGGLGIGLSLAKAIVELHGGTIAVRSAGPGQGSEFTVSLPVLAAQASPDIEAPAPAIAQKSAC